MTEIAITEADREVAADFVREHGTFGPIAAIRALEFTPAHRNFFQTEKAHG